jgi:hypothetical protein
VNLIDWDDKIVHLLEGIYEEAFLGFWYGFRPARRANAFLLDCQIVVFVL